MRVWRAVFIYVCCLFVYLFKNASSKIWDSHGGAAEEWNLPECYAVMTGEDLETFPGILVPLSSASCSPALLQDRLTFKMKALRFVETSVPVYLSARCNIAEGLTLPIAQTELNACMVNSLWNGRVMEVIVAEFEVLSGIWLQDWRRPRIPSIRVAGLHVVIWTQYFPNTKHDGYFQFEES